MSTILRRLETRQGRWMAEMVLRALGLALLGLCVAASLWLYHSVHRSPMHEHVLEWAGAMVIVMSWSAGGALLTVGPGLFEQIELPARYVRFPVTKGPE
ncbi:DNA translocase FtsK 4TM domain-containing protein [Sphingobium nicotianae]|uniref:DNA translocase FtsK 4TM domain-containing protein n=1 Tax=Sphingobium nicotianae TaxID=2782607 RepID=A0A9X1IPU3_9SPHN|nr:DNA translocase FtsK 4TM domain-containing protein [Sphingobium nicotianae]MBT2186121.1 DNA translocase FtsK 4TM domain-containing protein [Sphingobium nicotianae]